MRLAVYGCEEHLLLMLACTDQNTVLSLDPSASFQLSWAFTLPLKRYWLFRGILHRQRLLVTTVAEVKGRSGSTKLCFQVLCLAI